VLCVISEEMAFIAGFGPNVASKNASATCKRSLVVVMDGKGFGGKMGFLTSGRVSKDSWISLE